MSTLRDVVRERLGALPALGWAEFQDCPGAVDSLLDEAADLVVSEVWKREIEDEARTRFAAEAARLREGDERALFAVESTPAERKRAQEKVGALAHPRFTSQRGCPILFVDPMPEGSFMPLGEGKRVPVAELSAEDRARAVVWADYLDARRQAARLASTL